MAENGYAKPVLVATDWLAEHLNDSNVVVSEVDENPDLYDEGHIPGAVKLHRREDKDDSPLKPAMLSSGQVVGYDEIATIRLDRPDEHLVGAGEAGGVVGEQGAGARVGVGHVDGDHPSRGGAAREPEDGGAVEVGDRVLLLEPDLPLPEWRARDRGSD